MILGFNIFGFALKLTLPLASQVQSGVTYGYNNSVTGTLAPTSSGIIQEVKTLTTILKQKTITGPWGQESVTVYPYVPYYTTRRADGQTSSLDGVWDESIELPNNQNYIIVYRNSLGDQRVLQIGL